MMPTLFSWCFAGSLCPHTHQSLDRFRIQKDLSLVCLSMASNAEVGWVALPNDLIQKVIDNYLSTEDLDYYVFFRTLCGGWRRATAEPHFMPNNLIILDHSMS